MSLRSAATIVSLSSLATLSGAGFPPAWQTASAPGVADPGRVAKLAAAFPEVERIFERFREAEHIPGLVFGIVIDGQVVFAKGLGVRDTVTGAPPDLDTVFPIASMTKSFTALAILKLRDEARLTLDDPAEKWIPELRSLRYPTKDSAPITVRQLLTHGAGFPEDDPLLDRVGDDELSVLLRAGLPFSTPPGTVLEYSNYGYALLGRIVSRVSGRRYRDYVDAEIIGPLGLRSAKWEASAVPAERLASGYGWNDERWVREKVENPPWGPWGGLHVSGRDLARYMGFLMSAWPPRDDYDKGPVRRSSLREMQQAARFWELSADRVEPSAPLRAFAWGYGYGVNVVQTCRFRMVGHGGGIPGFGSNMRWLPDRGVGIFLLANRTYVEFLDVVLETLERLAATGALPPNVVQPSPALLAARDRVVGLVDRWDDAVAAELAASNLFLDEPAAARRKQLAELRRIHGLCHSTGEMETETALRGRWRMACEHGFLTVSIALAPTQPPKVQILEIKSSPPLTEPLRTSVTRLAVLGSAWDEAAADALFAPAVDRGRLRATFLALTGAYGACHVDEALEGDGRTKARIRLVCDRGAIIVDLVAGGDGRLLEPTFAQPRGTSCVP